MYFKQKCTNITYQTDATNSLLVFNVIPKNKASFFHREIKKTGLSTSGKLYFCATGTYKFCNHYNYAMYCLSNRGVYMLVLNELVSGH